MTKQCCANCVYATCSTHMKFSGFLTGFGRRPLCANHPDTPGRLRPVSAGGLCRNYRPKPPAPAQPEETVRRITLAHGQSVFVDAVDYEWLNQYKWTMINGYAARHEKGRTIYMHHEVVHAPKGAVVDHKDGNKQNNCASNLRGCNQRENLQNRPKRFGSVSRFKGVFCDKRSGKWYAQISIANVPFWLGTFADEVEAARAYDRLAVEVFGEFAFLNFPEDWPPERRQEAYAKKEMVAALRKERAQRAKRRAANAKKASAGSRQAKSKGKKAGRRTGRPPHRAKEPSVGSTLFTRVSFGVPPDELGRTSSVATIWGSSGRVVLRPVGLRSAAMPTILGQTDSGSR